MKRILFILLTITAFAACKKSDVTPVITPANEVAKIKTLTYGAGINTFTYDVQGRQVETKNTDGSKTEHEYSPGKINYKVYNNAGVYLYSFQYELNADGLINRVTMSNNPNYEQIITFNADKTIAKDISHINGVTNTIDYFYSNGNCDSLQFLGNDGKWNMTTYNTFYTDKPNNFNDANTGDDFYSKANKNLQKTQSHRFSDGTSSAVTTYTYEFDAAGRVAKKIITTPGYNTETGIFTYY